MATKISQLPTDSAVTGVELLTGIDGSTNKNLSVQQISDFANIAAATDATTKANAAVVTANTYTDTQVSGITLAGTSTTFNGTIKFDKILGRYATVNSSDITGAITVDATGAVQLGCYYLIVVEDGGGEPTFSTDFRFADSSEAYNTTDGESTLYMFQKVGITYHAGILQQGEAAAILSTPSFSADAISDTEIDLTSITYDGDSEAMTIERATNVGFTTGLTEIYSGVPKSSHSDDSLIASTHYYYRIKTTATGFTDSDYGYDDDTTDATGLTPLAAPGNFILTVDSTSAITASWDNVTGETGFFVVLATNAGFTTGVVNATKGVNILSHQFTGLLPLTTYYGHVKAIGDGVTSADSAYSTTDSDTTTAATLSAPTSFAAGTPTADGAPFTWVDPSDAPSNESSFLIQIAIAADTTYSGTIVTRTPAADATSAAAGTGLTDSTAYRSRIKKVGNGTSTLDSAWSSEVTFTTDAANGVADLDFTGSTDIIASGADWIPDPASGNAAYGNLGKANVAIDTGADGRAGCLFLTSGGSVAAVIGVHTSNAEVPYASMFAAFVSTGFQIYKIDDGGLSGGSIATVASGDYVWLARVSGVWKLQKSTAKTGPYTDLITLTIASPTGKFYIVTDMPGSSVPGALIHDATGVDLVP